MTRPVRLVGVPMDLGANRRGVDMGPSAIRYAGLADQLESTGRICADTGDLPVPHPAERNADAAEPADGRAKFLHEIETVCDDVTTAVEDAIEAGQVPLVLGGDHSIAIGSVAGASDDGDLGVVWFDAHGDFNTPQTTPSGNVHGMALAAILGIGSFAEQEWALTPSVSETNVALVGLRDVDDDERAAIRDSDVTAFTMSDIDDRGGTSVVDDALSIATTGTDGLHVSLDMDWVDPMEAPGVGTPVRGGVSYREAQVAMEHLAQRTESLRSFELVEVNPIIDERNQTAELACELAASAFGKRIL